KNLHLMTQCFVAGSVVADMEGIEECAEDAEVILKQNDSEVARVTTDVFGEFKIDKLGKKSGQYRLEVNSDSSGSISVEFDLGDESLYLGTLALAVGV
ncbi:MAG: oxidoreductase, partial [Pseudomonadota bacterium]|nr:oxidoreductase [Pseudomonadota bacterium]